MRQVGAMARYENDLCVPVKVVKVNGSVQHVKVKQSPTANRFAALATNEDEGNPCKCCGAEVELSLIHISEPTRPY